MKNKIAKSLFSLAKTPVGDSIAGLAFGKFSKLLPVKKLINNKYVIAFWHPKPFWEKHILIVPKKPIKTLASLKEEDLVYIKEVFKTAVKIVEKLDWNKKEYSLLVNGGKRQEVNQIHFHLISGKQIL